MEKTELEQQEAPPPKPTDDDLGSRLIEHWNGDVAFFYGTWHRYDNGVWSPDPSIDIEFWDVMIGAKWEGIRPTASKAHSVASYVMKRCTIPDEKINTSTQFINLKNGLYNLKTHQMEPHRRELYQTSQLPFAYDPDATCPTWRKFLSDVLVNEDGDYDMQLGMVIRQAFGYSLTEDVSQRVSFWLVGPSGTGKSTLLDVLIALAGESHVTVDLDELKKSQYQLADIAGKRVVTFTEPDSRGVLADGQYKRLVSSDTITARQIFGKPFRFQPVCKVWGAMNQPPRVVDRSEAVYGRVMIIPMNYVVPRAKWDRHLSSKLHNELPGIFNWAIDGLKQLKKDGKFQYSAAVEQARAEYRAENDVEQAFVQDMCIVGKGKTVKASQLYTAYKQWCYENGSQPKSSIKVSSDWKRFGFEKKRTSTGWLYRGVGLETRTLNDD